MILELVQELVPELVTVIELMSELELVFEVVFELVYELELVPELELLMSWRWHQSQSQHPSHNILPLHLTHIRIYLLLALSD